MLTYLKAVLISLLAFFAPIKSLFVLVAFAVILDTIFGFWSSHKLSLPLTSRKFFRLAKKICIYYSCLALSFGIDRLIMNDIILNWISIDFAFTKFIVLVLLSIEVFSIDEKIKKVNNGNGIFFYVKRLINVAKNVKEEYDELKEEFKDKDKD